MSDEAVPLVTRHARRRLKERAKLPQRAARKMARLALERGLPDTDPTIPLIIRARLDRAKERYRRDDGTTCIYRVYNGIVYVFGPDLVLLTVLIEDPDPHTGQSNKRREMPDWLRGERVRGDHPIVRKKLRRAKQQDYDE